MCCRSFGMDGFYTTLKTQKTISATRLLFQLMIRNKLSISAESDSHLSNYCHIFLLQTTKLFLVNRGFATPWIEI